MVPDAEQADFESRKISPLYRFRSSKKFILITICVSFFTVSCEAKFLPLDNY